MIRRALLPGLALPALLCAAEAPRVQAPDAPWLTFTTAHYRIHCPAAFESFGREVAGQVEGIHAQYLELVGFVWNEPIDIVIQDPVMESNGSAWPFLDRPMVVLWKTAPEPDSVIGHHRGWAEMLLTHELGHMHHLLRPQRNPNLWQRWTAILGPLPEKTPRWVTEGYATLIEGKLTGSGRPHSAIRAAVLRQWALEGKLPAYGALNGMDGFMGGSMAYLAGSAYLAWLEERAGRPKVLPELWTRLAGKRPFDEAFQATFGFGPQDGYQRFCAELTHTALEVERRAKALGLREGEFFTQLKGQATDLALSPDGTRLLARVLDPKQPGLWVWDLKNPANPKAKPREKGEPEDQAPAAPVVAPSHRLGRINAALPWKPVWRTSDTISFLVKAPDGEGVLQPEGWQWTLGQAPAPAAYAAPAPAAGGPGWKEVDGIWNLVDTQGKPLTRTVAAAWNPTATPDGKTLYYTRLGATGLQIRRLDATLPPLEARAAVQDPAPLVKDTALPRTDEPSPLPPPVPVAPHPYRVGESHAAFSTSGISLAPATDSLVLGFGGNDILGRLNWQALAAFGSGVGPRGAMAGASWHGWRWSPSLQAFSSLERPSSQSFLKVADFDAERRGLEFALEREDLGRPGSHLRPVAAFERISPAAGASLGRSLLGASADLGSLWSRGEQGVSGSLRGTAQQGRTDGHGWTLVRLGATAGWVNPWVPVQASLDAGRVSGDPTTFDRFHLGGLPTTLRPQALDASRVVQAALPAYSATGDRFLRLRGDLGGPVRAYLEHSTVWPGGASRPPALRVAGLELDSRAMGLPVDMLRRLLGNLTITAGLHRPLDGIMKDRTVGTLSMLLRP